LSQRAVTVAGAADEPLLPAQAWARKRPTVGGARLTRLERSVFAELPPYPDVERPRTRGDCENGPRPCPFVSCAHHLYLDVTDTPSITFNHPDREPWELKETCALDVADRGGVTLEEVGDFIGLTRERIRQVELEAVFKLRIVNDNQTKG
jgi:sigma-70-like protein